MPPVLRATPVDTEWNGVSAKHPCPICAANDGCHLHAEDAFASCSRRPSDWPLTNGSWLHRVEPALEDGPRPDVTSTQDEPTDSAPLSLRS